MRRAGSQRGLCALACLALGALAGCWGPEVKPEERPAAGAEAPALPEGVEAQAKAEAAKAPEVTPAQKAAALERFEAARTSLEAGDAQGALEGFLQAVERDPGLHTARVNAAVLLLRAGKNAEAKAQLRAVLKAQPDHAAASENLVRLQLKLGEVGQAKAELAQRVAQFPAALPLRTQYARVLIAEGKLGVALSEGKRVLKADERNVAAMLVLGDVWYRERKFELARDVLETAAAVDPRNAEVANLQAFVHLALEQKALAIEAFRRAVALEPSLAEARNNLGVLLTEANDFEGAARELAEAARLQGDRPGVWLNLGNALRGARRDAEAEQAYQKALALRPSDPNPLFNLGVLYLDGEFKGRPALERLQAASGFLARYKAAGGQDPKLPRWEAEAEKGIKKEKDRLVREERDKLKKADAARKAEEERKRREAGKLGSKEEVPDAPAAPAAPPPPKPSGKLGGTEAGDK